MRVEEKVDRLAIKVEGLDEKLNSIIELLKGGQVSQGAKPCSTAPSAAPEPIVMSQPPAPFKPPERRSPAPAPREVLRYGATLPLDKVWAKDPVLPAEAVDTAIWEKLSGPKLEPLLDDLDLVDLAFVVENIEVGRPLPRWQDVPKGARINKSNLPRIQMCISNYALSVVVLSYPWLDPAHPDQHLLTCQRLLPCLKAILQGADRLGAGHTVAMMMDYMCLPQKNVNGKDDRTDAEKARFKRALSSINEWYLHPFTTVLLNDVDLPPPSSGCSNLRPYLNRGWCSFELRTSCLIKDMFCLWSLAGYEKGGCGKEWSAAVQDAKAAILRAAPMPPDEFGQMLKDGLKAGTMSFTANADMELVIQQYHEAFHRSFSEAEELVYCNLRWPDSHMQQLAKALKYARENGLLAKCKRVCLWGNKQTQEGLKVVEDVLEGTNINVMIKV